VVLYHGTAFADEIKRDGFVVSRAGGGGRGLYGVWFTADLKAARRWAYVSQMRRLHSDDPTERNEHAKRTVITVEVADTALHEVIANTVFDNGPDEVVVFDPSDIIITQVEEGSDDD